MDTTAPLAFRLRPKTLDEFFGQEDIVGKGTVLKKAIEQDLLTSVIFGGPPGTGKTTLAKIIAETTKAEFIQLNAATSGVKDIKEIWEAILKRAIQHPKGYDGKPKVHPDALTKIAELANGDARIALNMLELAILMIGTKISRADAEKVLKKRARRYDKKGENHYDTISAFIKTMRGSDPDAALFWMFKMLAVGEEPRFLFRSDTEAQRNFMNLRIGGLKTRYRNGSRRYGS